MYMTRNEIVVDNMINNVRIAYVFELSCGVTKWTIHDVGTRLVHGFDKKWCMIDIYIWMNDNWCWLALELVDLILGLLELYMSVWNMLDWYVNDHMIINVWYVIVFDWV